MATVKVNKLYNFSFIIIGKNTEKTIKSCINYIQESVLNTNNIDKYQIIYVDSNSSDNSVEIAKKFDIQHLEIIEGYTTASLGRYLGKQFAAYDNLLFIDSDMNLDINWFNDSFDFFIKYGAIIGERYEKLYKNDKLIKEIPRFYNIKEVEVALNIGGFLMIRKNIIKNINYSPIIRNEEEKDFYAKFYNKQKIYMIPVLAYVHNNYNLTASRIKDYMDPYSKNGYILSLISSIKNGYFKNYAQLQRKYILSMVIALVFYFSILTGYSIGILSVLLLLFNGIKQFKGSVATMLFFPYKLLMSFILLLKKTSTKYIYENNNYELEIKL